MIKRNLTIVFILTALNSFCQVNELEKFRAEIALFINYDKGKIDSLPKSIATTERLKKNYETAFLAFIKNKDSRNLDNLKKNSIDNKSSNIIGNNSYFLSSLRKDYTKKSLDNNVNYSITLYPIYDYGLPNFVSIFIQPFIIDSSEYVAYYCKLNGKGIYYIKDAKSNEIVFKSTGLTSNAPIKDIKKIDDTHLFVIEDLGDNGERALVIEVKQKKWSAIKGFFGKEFTDNLDYAKTTENQKRYYFTFSETRIIVSLYGVGFLKKYEMQFDTTTKTLSYIRYNKNESDCKTIKAKWENNSFKIDDYFIGQDIDNRPLPMPD
jgi:hypothetical protein